MKAEDIGYILDNEIVEVMGCTEPASIALAVHSAVGLLEKKIGKEIHNDNKLKIYLYLSPEVHRNATTVTVPVIEKKGIKAAAVCGLFGESESLNILASIDRIKLDDILRKYEEDKWLEICKCRQKGVYIEASAVYNGDRAETNIIGRHDIVNSKKLNSKDICRANISTQPEIKNIQDIVNAVSISTPDIEKKVKDWILSVGEHITENNYSSAELINRIIKERMSGKDISLKTITGSGNQGIFLAAPFFGLIKEDEKKAVKAALISILTQVLLSREHGRLSGECGFTNKAGPALAAGLTYYYGGNLSKITSSMKDVQKVLNGMKCEGAEINCALKAKISFIVADSMTGKGLDG